MSASADSPAMIPHRKVIRSWLEPYRISRTAYALGLLTVDWVLFGLLLIGAALIPFWPLKIVLGTAAGFMIGRLFVIGHDACHQSFTRHKTLNKWLGRIAMIPSMTPYSLWQVGHNVVHHGYTNLKGVDFVWEPLTTAEFQAMSRPRQILERAYRSGWGTGLYYFIEVWWLRMYFPSERYMQTRRAEFVWDCVLVTVIAMVWVLGLLWASQILGQSFWLLLATVFILPLVVWNTVIGFVVYVHHTHKDIRWYDNKVAWGAASPFVSTTVHLKLPFGLGRFFHNIMEHTAHHVDMGIPLYSLDGAQETIEESLPGQVTVQAFSLAWYIDTARCCKLYDFERGGWTDFKGHILS